MPRKFDRVTPGDLVTARHFNQLYDELERLARVTGSGPVTIVDDMGGIHIDGGQIVCDSFWIKITGYAATNKYAWIKMYEQSGGSFLPSTVSGESGTTSVNWAVEANGITTVPSGMIMRAWRDNSRGQHVIFQGDNC